MLKNKIKIFVFPLCLLLVLGAFFIWLSASTEKIILRALDRAGFTGATVENVSFFGDTVRIQDLRIPTLGLIVESAQLSPLVSRRAVHIVAENISYQIKDFTTQNVHAELTYFFSHTDQKVDVASAQFPFADGKIFVAPFTFMLATGSADILVTAQNLDLQQLLHFVQVDGLSAEGRMGGTLPILIRDGKIAVRNGSLKSLGPGVLRYNPLDPPAFLQDTSMPQVADLRVALADFHYARLSMDIDGEPGANQSISLKIEGKNPVFYGGHPVSFNLNIEGPLENVIRYAPGNKNIPDALQEHLDRKHGDHGNAPSSP